MGTYIVTLQQLFLEKIEPTKGRGSIVARYVGYFDGTILDYKFAGLKTYTYYTLYYIGTNEDPRFFLDQTLKISKTSKV